MSRTPDLIVVNAAVFTGDPAGTTAEAFAVVDGEFTAVGSSEEITRLAGPETAVVDADGRMIMPGICDVHTHLGLGGASVAWDLRIAPHHGLDEICEAVEARAAELEPGEWIAGGVIGSTTMAKLSNVDALAGLDRASGGHPVVIKDDTQHNRWVNSAALEAMGVMEDSPDPEGGTYVRDEAGRLTGVLWEQASRVAEEAFAASIENPEARNRVTFATAAKVCNEVGVTTACDAATTEPALNALSTLEAEGELTLRVVTSTVARPLLAEAGISGKELLAVSERFGSELLHVGFVKVFLDGVPMTRTAAMLDPYLPDGCSSHGPGSGECLYDLDGLVDELEEAVSAGRGVKIHAAGDASARMALDAIEVMRQRHGSGPAFHIAHPLFVDPSDVRRFAELGIVADASPYLWYPSIIQDSMAACVPARTLEKSYPLADLLSSGANVSAGSDWPAGAPMPHPWTGIETMVTREAPGGSEETINSAQRITLQEALVSFTRRPAEALGLGERVGSIEVGKSADFLVLSQNLFDVDVRRIHGTNVLATYLRGTRVHDANA
ncbi:amidohydrolase [Streptomyces sp. ML-6]|uniref:amidohydrolase n=1 Tax=Streptomyces sp. ML-6 TaxID=2982693 RepID=UPI0024BF78BF|nr:amidohydrolase [Streptomyces sp. ML-6]MDK0524307.1 amidohydrolase [Streptomyces sp. ML-6]